MNKKLTIIPLLLSILALIAFMVYDLFYSGPVQENPYELETDSLQTDSIKALYNEVAQIKVSIEDPRAIAIDDNDNLIVSGSGTIVYDKSGKEILNLKHDSIAQSVAVSDTGEIYLGMPGYIEVWSMTGKKMRQWNMKNPASVLSGIVVDENSVYVSDAKDRVVHQYDLKGTFISDIGAEDSTKGIPAIIIRSAFFDVALGRDDEIWMVNPGMYQLEAFDKKGNLKSSWGGYSNDDVKAFCGCCNPTHIALLSDRSFVTSEKAIPRVKIYDQTGTFVGFVVGPDNFNPATKGLDLAVDSQNRIYVLDPERKQVRIFEKIKGK